jgi:hydroxylamine reductase
VIQKALELPGFSVDKKGKYVTVGFGRNALLSVAGKVIDAVKNGHIK